MLQVLDSEADAVDHLLLLDQPVPAVITLSGAMLSWPGGSSMYQTGFRQHHVVDHSLSA